MQSCRISIPPPQIPKSIPYTIQTSNQGETTNLGGSTDTTELHPTPTCQRVPFVRALVLFDNHIRTRIQLLKSPQVHLCLEQGLHIRIKRLPVRILKVVFLTLSHAHDPSIPARRPRRITPHHAALQTALQTHRLALVALHDGEVPPVVHALHDVPAERLPVARLRARLRSAWRRACGWSHRWRPLRGGAPVCLPRRMSECPGAWI